MQNGCLSDIPKLFMTRIRCYLDRRQRDFCRNWPNQTEIKVSGSHFVQDSQMKLQAIYEWMHKLN